MTVMRERGGNGLLELRERPRGRFALTYGWILYSVGEAAWIGWRIAQSDGWSWVVAIVPITIYALLFFGWRLVLSHLRWLARRGRSLPVRWFEWVLLAGAYVILALQWTVA